MTLWQCFTNFFPPPTKKSCMKPCSWQSSCVELRDIHVHIACFSISVWFVPYLGGPSIREYRILGDRQHVLTRDSNGHVQLWDVLHVRHTHTHTLFMNNHRVHVSSSTVTCIFIKLFLYSSFLLQAVKEADFGEVDIDEEVEKRKCTLYTPNWFSVEVKTGVSHTCNKDTLTTGVIGENEETGFSLGLCMLYYM